MGMRQNSSAASRSTDAALSGKAGRRLRRMLAGVAVVALLGGVAVAGQFVGDRFVNGQPSGAAEATDAADANVGDGFQSDSPMHSAPRWQELPVVSKTWEPARGHFVAAYETVRAEPGPEQDKRLEEWREEGIRMAAELTGIPEAFFRWLADQGLPVGEFMRFLAPFLEWLDLVEPHNGTKAQPPRKGQAPTTI